MAMRGKVDIKEYLRNHPFGHDSVSIGQKPPVRSREAPPDAPIYTRGFWAVGVTRLPKPAPKKPNE